MYKIILLLLPFIFGCASLPYVPYHRESTEPTQYYDSYINEDLGTNQVYNVDGAGNLIGSYIDPATGTNPVLIRGN